MLKGQYYLLLLWALFLVDCNRPIHSKIPLSKAPVLDERLEKIVMKDLDGHSTKLSDYSGKPVFLNFWATWCGPCISEMKSIEQAAQRFNQDLVFLAASNESMELIQSFAKKHPQSFQFVRMEPTYLDVYVVKLPTTFLIDRHGQLMAEEEGFRDWSSQSSLNMLENLIKK